MSQKKSSKRIVLDDIVKQIAALYSEPALQQFYIEFFKKQAGNVVIESAPTEVETVIAACKKLGLQNAFRLYKVESDYYDWELQRRAFRLLAPSINHLCKTVVFENKRCPHENFQDPFDSRFYAIIVQYTSAIDMTKLVDFIRAGSQNRYSKKLYNLRLAQAEKCLELTGFKYGGVSPIGMFQKIPIIIDKAICNLKPAVFYVGAGDIDWKLGLVIDEFVETICPLIADLS